MRIQDIVQARMRYGYFKTFILLRREGWMVKHKRVCRLYREDGLSLALKRPRRHVNAARQASAAPQRDVVDGPFGKLRTGFVSDALFEGWHLCALAVVDAYAREALAIDVDQGIKGEQVVETMNRIASLRGAPRAIRVDNWSRVHLEGAGSLGL
jgi:putative transposase